MPMPHSFDPQFYVDETRCIACGLCVEDCVSGVLAIQDGKAAMSANSGFGCVGCQHCLAVCPVGAVSVMGVNPDDVTTAKEPALDPAALDLFVRRRRSIRKFSKEPVTPELLDRILAGVGYAPTGVNSMMRHFTAIRDPEVMNRFRKKCAELLISKGNELAPEWRWFVDAAQEVLQGGRDAGYERARRAYLVGYDRSISDMRQASRCTGCNICTRHCPQGIAIPEQMTRLGKFVEQLRSRSEA